MVDEMQVEERQPDAPVEAPPQPQQRGRRGITIAILLIGLGTALLLGNLGIISINWLNLLQFWPLILILMGLDIMLGGRSVLGSLSIAALGIALVIGAIIWAGVGPGTGPGGQIVTKPIQQELGDVTALKATLELGAANADIHAEHGSTYAVKGEYHGDERMPIDVSYERNGDTGALDLTQKSDKLNNLNIKTSELTLGLTDAVPVNLTVNAGVGNATFDLTDIQLDSLDLNGGVGNVTLTLPGSGKYNAKIDAGVGNITVYIPKEIEARIHYDSGISELNIDSRFHKIDDETWETSGYSDADNAVDIDINAGIGNVNIKYN